MTVRFAESSSADHFFFIGPSQYAIITGVYGKHTVLLYQNRIGRVLIPENRILVLADL